jgi:Sulfotransferase family
MAMTSAMNAIANGSIGQQLEIEALLKRAQLMSGLSDFGDLWFKAPLGHLLEFVNREADLPNDKVWPVERLIDMLTDRLKLVDYLKRHPDVLNEKVDVAGIIVMHARGGSTLTQRLLGRSPQLRATYFWELHRPVPLPQERRGDPSERIRIGDAEVAAWAAAMPEHKAMHPHDAQFHEEDLVLGDRGFLSYMYSCQFNIPGYHAWMAAQDETRAYEELRLWLQLLQYQSPQFKERKWLLKSVHHFIGRNLRTMFKTFPGAKAIQTHRRMDQVIPSLCSVQSMHIRQSGSSTFDKTQMGGRLIEQYLPAFQDMMAVREEMPADSFVDLQYRDLLSDPIGQFVRLMQSMGLEATPVDIAEASTWMANNGRDTHPRHEYTAEEFGTSNRQLSETFKFYHDAFGVR